MGYNFQIFYLIGRLINENVVFDILAYEAIH